MKNKFLIPVLSLTTVFSLFCGGGVTKRSDTKVAVDGKVYCVLRSLGVPKEGNGFDSTTSNIRFVAQQNRDNAAFFYTDFSGEEKKVEETCMVITRPGDYPSFICSNPDRFKADIGVEIDAKQVELRSGWQKFTTRTNKVVEISAECGSEYQSPKPERYIPIN